MTTATVQAQESVVKVSFTDEVGDIVEYDLETLSEVISASDTLADDDWIMEEYESVFSSRGPYEPAVLVLGTKDDYFDIIFIQSTVKGKLITLRILTRDGWMEADKNALRIFEKIIN